MKPTLDVAIVGAGAAGIGLGLMLQAIGVERFALLERHEVGASFRRWPRETRFITPSFYGNPFGLPDLNAVSPASSPAINCGSEHPSGEAYARYLELLAQTHELPLITGCAVRTMTPLPGGGFEIVTDQAREQRAMSSGPPANTSSLTSRPSREPNCAGITPRWSPGARSPARSAL